MYHHGHVRRLILELDRVAKAAGNEFCASSFTLCSSLHSFRKPKKVRTPFPLSHEYHLRCRLVPRHRCECGELCQFVQMGDVVEAFLKSPLLIRSLQIPLTISVSLDTFHSWLENRTATVLEGSVENHPRAQHVSHVFRTPAHHSMDKYRMSRAKGHDTATLHTSQSCTLCCIAGLEPGIVSASSSAFHVLWFSSTSSA